MTPDLEKALAAKARPILEKGRKGDWEHTLRTIEYGRKLLSKEDGEEDIVIPALYLHDTGWSAIDYQDFLNASPARKKRPAACNCTWSTAPESLKKCCKN